LEVVKSVYQGLPLEVFHDDFIDLFIDRLFNGVHPVLNTLYDLVISNPPYGLYLDPSYRKLIKSLYPTVYARESYGLFFVFAISRLREDGRYVFLLPDTFLASVNHRSLREFMCSQAAPTHIIRFPSKLFETVNFGYGNLCIIAGEKRALQNDDTVLWLDVFDNTTVLTINSLRHAVNQSGERLRQQSRLGWSAPHDIAPEEFSLQTLGNIAECRTGIYTGDNERFIGYDAARITRRLNGHAIDWSKVYTDPLTSLQRETGLLGERCYVPFVRGGHRETFENTPWAINWSPEAVNFYKTNKKARLQNSRFYFETGISVPMVSSKRISAAHMHGAVFDQGVVGVFPFNKDLFSALLLYLNSRTASERIKRLVNGSANNSANYLKRIPVPIFTPELCQLAKSQVTQGKRNGGLTQAACDDFTAVCDLPV